jgi:hypothetical protein
LAASPMVASSSASQSVQSSTALIGGDMFVTL